ncbi:MAG: hypothetical protein RSE91_01555 [Bacilli bacterium]
MKDDVISLVGDILLPLNMFVDDVFMRREEGIMSLCVVLDSEEVITINRIVEATKLISPIITKTDLLKEGQILDIYSKEKGEVR